MTIEELIKILRRYRPEEHVFVAVFQENKENKNDGVLTEIRSVIANNGHAQINVRLKTKN